MEKMSKCERGRRKGRDLDPDLNRFRNQVERKDRRLGRRIEVGVRQLVERKRILVERVFRGKRKIFRRGGGGKRRKNENFKGGS